MVEGEVVVCICSQGYYCYSSMKNQFYLAFLYLYFYS